MLFFVLLNGEDCTRSSFLHKQFDVTWRKLGTTTGKDHLMENMLGVTRKTELDVLERSGWIAPTGSRGWKEGCTEDHHEDQHGDQCDTFNADGRR